MSRNTVQLRARPEEAFTLLCANYPLAPTDEDPPHRVTFRKKIAPGLESDVEFTFLHNEDGTELVMWEEPVGLWRRTWNPVADRLLWARNVMVLERLQAKIDASVSQDVPTVVGAATALAFWGAGHIRGQKAFHPKGDLYEAELTILPDPTLPSILLLREEGTHRAIVRLSRGAGLPSVLPDFPGLAIKLPDHWGPGADQDFLLVSSGPGAIGRRVLMPAPSEIAPQYSSITPYKTRETRVWFGAEPTAPERFAFRAAFDSGGWKAVGSLILGDRVESGDEVDFDIWNTHRDLVPAGVVNALRKPAYAGSREGRGDG
jgi:hypothetical protein